LFFSRQTQYKHQSGHSYETKYFSLILVALLFAPFSSATAQTVPGDLNAEKGTKMTKQIFCDLDLELSEEKKEQLYERYRVFGSTAA
jgi:hypothetical protein